MLVHSAFNRNYKKHKYEYEPPKWVFGRCQGGCVAKHVKLQTESSENEPVNDVFWIKTCLCLQRSGPQTESRVSRVQLCVSEEWLVHGSSSSLQERTWTLTHRVRDCFSCDLLWRGSSFLWCGPCIRTQLHWSWWLISQNHSKSSDLHQEPTCSLWNHFEIHSRLILIWICTKFHTLVNISPLSMSVKEDLPPPPPPVLVHRPQPSTKFTGNLLFFITPLTNQPTHKHTGWKQNLLDRSMATCDWDMWVIRKCLHRERKRSHVPEEEQSSCCASCQDVLKDLVSTSCGHWFCRQCITSYWDQCGSSGDSSCPQCGQRSRTGAGGQTAGQSSTVHVSADVFTSDISTFCSFIQHQHLTSLEKHKVKKLLFSVLFLYLMKTISRFSDSLSLTLFLVFQQIVVCRRF